MELPKYLKKKDLGIASVVMILTQTLSSIGSTDKISADIHELRTELRQSLVERERFFVRKAEIEEIQKRLLSVEMMTAKAILEKIKHD